MEASQQFRRRALACFRWAQSALTARARAEWLNLAQFWHQLAQTAEQEQRDATRSSDRDGGQPRD